VLVPQKIKKAPQNHEQTGMSLLKVLHRKATKCSISKSCKQWKLQDWRIMAIWSHQC